MKEYFNIKHIEKLKKSISEVTSISIDIDYDIEGSKIEGEFSINGTYKSHGLSLNQDSFTFDVPFTYEIKNNIIKDTIKVDIEDFIYNIDSYDLCLDISYKVFGEEMKEDYDDLEEFNRFLDEHEVDIIDLKEEDIEEVIEPVLDRIEIEPTFDKEPVIFEETNTIEETTILEENYITYHIYICNESDTLDSIALKYNVSPELIKEYNEINNITLGTKLIIPSTNE